MPLAAGDEAARSMKQTGSRPPAGSEYSRMLLPDATARLLTRVNIQGQAQPFVRFKLAQQRQTGDGVQTRRRVSVTGRQQLSIGAELQRRGRLPLRHRRDRIQTREGGQIELPSIVGRQQIAIGADRECVPRAAGQRLPVGEQAQVPVTRNSPGNALAVQPPPCSWRLYHR